MATNDYTSKLFSLATRPKNPIGDLSDLYSMGLFGRDTQEDRAFKARQALGQLAVQSGIQGTGWASPIATLAGALAMGYNPVDQNKQDQLSTYMQMLDQEKTKAQKEQENQLAVQNDYFTKKHGIITNPDYTPEQKQQALLELGATPEYAMFADKEKNSQDISAIGAMGRGRASSIYGKLPEISPDMPQEERLALLKAQNPKAYNFLKPLAEGKISIGGRGLYGTEMASDASNFFGGDMTLFETRKKTRQSFSSGKDKDNLKALNTAVAHAQEGIDALEGFETGNVRLLNKAMNAIKTDWQGSPTIPKFEFIKTAIADEFATAFKGSAGTDTSMGHLIDQIQSSSSPQQLREVLKTAMSLGVSRVIPSIEQWHSVFPNERIPSNVVGPAMKKVLERNGYTFDERGTPIKPQNNGMQQGAAVTPSTVGGFSLFGKRNIKPPSGLSGGTYRKLWE